MVEFKFIEYGTDFGEPPGGQSDEDEIKFILNK